MRVAIVCLGVGRARRGYEAFSRELFEHLKGRIDVHLVKGAGNPSAVEHVVPGLSRDNTLLRPFPQQVRYEAEMRTSAPALVRHLLRERYDIVHFSEHPLGLGLRPLKRFWRGAPRLIFSNGGPVWARYYKDYVDHIHHINGASFGDDGLNDGFPRQRMTLIPYGVDPGALARRPTDFRHRHGIPRQAFVVLSVGATNASHKRMDHLIREVAGIGDPRLMLLVAGAREAETARIEALGRELLGDRVRFLSLPHDQVRYAYWASDLFVLCSLQEGLGLVLLEAMATGVPVVAHDAPGQRWTLGGAASLIDMTEPGRLAREVADLRGDGPRRRALAAAGVERVDREYAWDRLVPKYLAMYNAVMEAH